MKRPATILSLLFLLGAFTTLHAAASGSSLPGGWSEHSAGLLVSRPELALSGTGAALSGQADLKPGSGIVFETEREFRDAAVNLAVQADTVNRKSLDYTRGESHYLFSATVVFGREKLEQSWTTRIGRFFENIWYGFPPGGIRLTYAFGGRAPVGSMFRITEEETVFVIAGQDETGKRVESRRVPEADFRAAYGRAPKGPVTGFVIRLDRPSNEKGNAKVSFDLKPAP